MARPIAGRALRGRDLELQPSITWASIGATNGAASDETYVDADGIRWRYTRWNASHSSGLVLTTGGWLDVVLMGTGSGWANNYHHPSGNGVFRDGLHPFASGTHEVFIAATKPYWSNAPSTDDPLVAGTRLGQYDTGLSKLASWNAIASTPTFSSRITGNLLEFGGPGGTRNPGSGALYLGGDSMPGTVIIRTPV